jgi:glycerophosphoryl diester phosphodiesterase
MRLPAEFLRLPLAHRALHNRSAGRPENSPAAIRAAVAAGYGIEIDVQGTRDGLAVVFHDEWMERLTDAVGFVKDRSAQELGAICLKDCTETIPTLPEVLALVGGKVPVLIEIKDQTGTMSDTDGRLEAATAAALVGYAGPVAVMSFNPHCMAQMARLAPDVARGLTTSGYDPADWGPLPAQRCDELRAIGDYSRTGCCFISHEAADLDRARVAELKAQGAAVLTWTIRSAVAEAKARRIADNVTFEAYLAALPA